MRNNKPSDHKMRKIIGKNSYYKSLLYQINKNEKHSLVSRLYEYISRVGQWRTVGRWKGGQEARHDNDRLRMINQGGVEMSMCRDPY